MGVIYKLKPEIKNFILEKKKANPALSCRNMAKLIADKFQIKVSKSAINSLFKSANLSMPVGRRCRRKRASGVVEAEGLGIILLKAADSLLGGSSAFAEGIKEIKNFSRPAQVLGKIECLLYHCLFTSAALLRTNCGLWALINQYYTPQNISSYLNVLQEVTALKLDIFQIISQVLQEVRYLKVVLSDQSILYLDGQLHTVWSTSQIPYDFSTTVYDMKSYIKKYFQEGQPFILFMAPGYNTPSKDFFSFILSLETGERRISKLALYGNQAQELEVISLEQAKKCYFIFGLWPWQFKEYRKVSLIGEFRQFSLRPFQQDFFLADTEAELSQPNINKMVTLRGCALKTALNDKIRLLILSNLPFDRANSESIASSYLSRWPNLEETFQDFSRKIELFTYAASSHRFFSPEKLNLERDASSDIQALFQHYLKGLDLYVKWHFFPTGYEDKSFQTIKEQFYDLKATLQRKKEEILVIFQLPCAYPAAKDLEYACCRINERGIVFADGRRLWLSVALLKKTLSSV